MSKGGIASGLGLRSSSYFMGPGIEPRKIHRRVHPVDVAPTLAAFMGMTPPAAARGTPLEEVY